MKFFDGQFVEEYKHYSNYQEWFEYLKPHFLYDSWDILTENTILYPHLEPMYTLNLESIFRDDLFKLTYEEFLKSDKKFIAIVEPTESTWRYEEFRTKDGLECNVIRYIHLMCERTSVPQDKILFITNDLNCREAYDEWFEYHNFDSKINLLGYPMYINILLSDYRRKGLREVKPKNPNKTFISLFGRRDEYRERMYNYIVKSESLNNKSYVSNMALNKLLPNSHVDMDKFQKEVENEITTESDFEKDVLEQYYDDSYFSLVPESANFLPMNNPTGFKTPTVFLSEKLTRAIYYGHPFLIWCYPGVLKQLKEWGFHTFSEIFDESYDEIEDVDDRCNAILLELERVSQLDWKNMDLKSKLEHNCKILLEFKKPTEIFIQELKGLCSQ